jgi:hypothetical protein
MRLASALRIFPRTDLLGIERDGDNREFVVERILPAVDPRPEVRQVIRWAYGYDGSGGSYEMESDGSSLVEDLFMGGLLKEPFGVGHDWLYWLQRTGQADPSGHVWTRNEADNWYRKAAADFGYPWRAIVRRVGLFFGSWIFWGRHS